MVYIKSIVTEAVFTKTQIINDEVFIFSKIGRRHITCQGDFLLVEARQKLFFLYGVNPRVSFISFYFILFVVLFFGRN